MDEQQSARSGRPADDRVLPLTKAVAVLVIPFLLAAFVVLYLPGDLIGDWYGWPIRPQLTAAIMGAGYLAGAYFFARVWRGAHWHHVARGFLPVTAFTLIMLFSTLIHRASFNSELWAFRVWLAIYMVTPVLVPLAWWRNRPTDPGTPDARDFLLPSQLRPIMMAAGIALSIAVVILLIRPQWAAMIWPWAQTPLTMRILAGWQSLLAVGAITLAHEQRWSGWRIPLQSIVFWQALVVVAFVLYRSDLHTAGLLNWYVIYTVGGLLLAVLFYGWADAQARKKG